MIPHQIGYQNIEDQKPFEWYWDMMEEDAREMKVRIVLFIMLCTVYILTEFIKHIIIFDIVLILISICLFTYSIFYILKRYKAY